jgi:hypothetical protein
MSGTGGIIRITSNNCDEVKACWFKVTVSSGNFKPFTLTEPSHQRL